MPGICLQGTPGSRKTLELAPKSSSLHPQLSLTGNGHPLVDEHQREISGERNLIFCSMNAENFRQGIPRSQGNPVLTLKNSQTWYTPYTRSAQHFPKNSIPPHPHDHHGPTRRHGAITINRMVRSNCPTTTHQQQPWGRHPHGT